MNLQGFHSEGGTLAILDEAVGVPDSIWDAIEATLTGTHDRLLAIANPSSKAGRFGSLWSQKASTNLVHISAFDTPNLEAARTVIPGMATREWVEDKRVKWGVGSALWCTKVLGEFPLEDDQALVPVAWLDAAVARWNACAGQRPEGAEGEAGLDVARFGDDRTVMAPVYFGHEGTVIGALIKTAKQSTMETVGMTVQRALELGLTRVRVDAAGVGGGVYDRLAELGTPEPVEMIAGRASSDSRRYLNARAEWLWALREAMNPDAETHLALPPDDELAHQATTIRWKLTSVGQIQIESKDDWRDRTGKSSPDELDAVAQALARGAGNVRGVAPAYV